jgi:hypothetical protein
MAKWAPTRATRAADSSIRSATPAQPPFPRMHSMYRARGIELIVISGWSCSPMTPRASRQMVR